MKEKDVDIGALQDFYKSLCELIGSEWLCWKKGREWGVTSGK